MMRTILLLGVALALSGCYGMLRGGGNPSYIYWDAKTGDYDFCYTRTRSDGSVYTYCP